MTLAQNFKRMALSGSRILFVSLVAWPLARLWLGITVRNRARLPKQGPAIIAANHNSHLDAIALLAMMPWQAIGKTRSVAASDYFFTNRFVKFFVLYVIGILPVERGAAKRGEDPLALSKEALKDGQILIIFPEGTRSEPERMAEVKKGIWHLAQACPEAPVVPVFFHGLGRCMPKGGWLPLPMFIHCAVGRPLRWRDDKEGFIEELKSAFERLSVKTAPGHEALLNRDLDASKVSGSAARAADAAGGSKKSKPKLRRGVV